MTTNGARGRERNQWPRILHLINREDEAKSDWRVSAMEYNGRIVLDGNNHPVMLYLELPLTLSSKMDPWLIEAILRLNPKIGCHDLWARMPRSTVPSQKVANSLSMRASRFRHKAGLTSWSKRRGTDNNNNWLMSKYPVHCVQANSVEHFRDLTSAELEQMKAANKGQFEHLKGVQKPEFNASQSQPQCATSVLGKRSHLEDKQQAEGEQAEAFNKAEHIDDPNQAMRASKRQKTTTQRYSKSDAVFQRRWATEGHVFQFPASVHHPAPRPAADLAPQSRILGMHEVLQPSTRHYPQTVVAPAEPRGHIAEASQLSTDTHCPPPRVAGSLAQPCDPTSGIARASRPRASARDTVPRAVGTHGRNPEHTFGLKEAFQPLGSYQQGRRTSKLSSGKQYPLPAGQGMFPPSTASHHPVSQNGEMHSHPEVLVKGGCGRTTGNRHSGPQGAGVYVGRQDRTFGMGLGYPTSRPHSVLARTPLMQSTKPSEQKYQTPGLTSESDNPLLGNLSQDMGTQDGSNPASVREEWTGEQDEEITFDSVLLGTITDAQLNSFMSRLPEPAIGDPELDFLNEYLDSESDTGGSFGPQGPDPHTGFAKMPIGVLSGTIGEEEVLVGAIWTDVGPQTYPAETFSTELQSPMPESANHPDAAETPADA